jgi:hypothetical protein
MKPHMKHLNLTLTLTLTLTWWQVYTKTLERALTDLSPSARQELAKEVPSVANYFRQEQGQPDMECGPCIVDLSCSCPGATCAPGCNALLPDVMDTHLMPRTFRTLKETLGGLPAVDQTTGKLIRKSKAQPEPQP